MKIKTVTTLFFLAAVFSIVSMLLKNCLETDLYIVFTYLTFGLLFVTVGLYAFYDVFLIILTPKGPRMYERQIKSLSKLIKISNKELEELNKINTYEMDVSEKVELSERIVKTEDQIQAMEISMRILIEKLDNERAER